MRSLTILFTLIALLVGLQALGLGAGAVAAPEDDVADRVAALEARAAYLEAREEALTAHALQAEARGEALAEAVKLAVKRGFTRGAIPTDSREALVEGLEAYAAAVGADLPAPTKEHKALKQAAAAGN